MMQGDVCPECGGESEVRHDAKEEGQQRLSRTDVTLTLNTD